MGLAKKVIKIFATTITPLIICPLLVFYFQKYYEKTNIKIKSKISANEFSINIENESEESLEDVRILVNFSSPINPQSIQGNSLDTGISLPLSFGDAFRCRFEGSKEGLINLRSHEVLQIKGRFKSAIAPQEPHVIVQSGKKGYADSVKQKQDKLIANGISLAALAFFLGVFLYYCIVKLIVDVIIVAMDKRKTGGDWLEYSRGSITLERFLLQWCCEGNRYAIKILDRLYMPIARNKFSLIGMKKSAIEKLWWIIRYRLYEIVETSVPLERPLTDVIRDITEDIIYDFYQSLLDKIAERFEEDEQV